MSLKLVDKRRFIAVCHLLYAQTVLQLPFSDQIHSRVQGPLVLTSKDDVGSIKPGHLGDFVIDVTPVGTELRGDEESQRLDEKMQFKTR